MCDYNLYPGVGQNFYFPLQITTTGVKVFFEMWLPCHCCLVVKSCPASLRSHRLQPSPLSMGFFSKNTRVGCHFLLQGIFWTQGLNLHLLHWQTYPSPLCHKGRPFTEGKTYWNLSWRSWRLNQQTIRHI